MTEENGVAVAAQANERSENPGDDRSPGATAEAQQQEGDEASRQGGERATLSIQVSPPAVINGIDDMAAVLHDHMKWVASVLNPRAEILGGRANLTSADLSGFNLSGVDLRGANLAGATLRGTILAQANLTGASLKNADLQGADLRGAKLKRANLEGADLRDIDLEDADLRGANLKDTIMDPLKQKGSQHRPTQDAPEKPGDSQVVPQISDPG